MSELGPPDYQQPLPMNYETPSPSGNAPALLRLAAILNFVMAGLDCVYGLVLFGMCVFVLWLSAHPAAVPGAAGAGGSPPAVFAAVYIPMGLAAIAAGIVKVISGVKILRHSPGAWGWGLAAGIVGCCQIWCSIMCVMPLAIGIYTIVAVSLSHVRVYLQTPLVRAPERGGDQ